jgi:outer membrane autotransporter protein
MSVQPSNGADPRRSGSNRQGRLAAGVSLFALCLAGGLALPRPAAALCDNNAPAGGDVVTCVAPDDATGVQGNADMVTVNILAGGSITTVGGLAAINLDDDATVSLAAGAMITTTGTVGRGMDLGDNAEVTIGGDMMTTGDAVFVGNDSFVRLLGTGSITGADDDVQAIEAGANATIITDAGSIITTFGHPSSTTGDIGTAIVVGANGNVDLGGDIMVSGKANGVSAGDDLTLLLREGASIAVDSGIPNFSGIGGAIVAANGADITIAGQITTNGNSMDGIHAGGTNSSAANPTNITVTGTGSIHTAGTGAEAIFLRRPAAPGAMPPPFVANVIIEAGGSVIADQSVAITEDTGQVLQSLTLTSLTVAGTVETGVINGTAINLFIGDDRLELHTTYAIVGDVLGGDGTDDFVLGGPAGDGMFDASALDGDGVDEGEQFLGFETFVKEDASTWTLTGINDETFAWDVTGGGLFVTGTLANSTFDLSTGADAVLFGGTGTIAAFMANDGATVAPGTLPDQIATLSVNSGFTFEPGSTFLVDLDGTPVADLIAGTGVGTINGGTIDVNAMPGSYEPGERFTVVDVTSQAGPGFDAPVVDNLIFYDFLAIHDAGLGLVELEVVQDFQGPARTPNQRGAADGLEDLDPGDPTLDDLRTLLSSVGSEEEARALLDSLSGEIYATNLLLAANTGEIFNRSIRNRGRLLGGTAIAQQMAAGDAMQRQLVAAAHANTDDPLTVVAQAGEGAMADDGAITPWVGIFGEYNAVDGDGNAAEVDQWIGGIALGLETGWQAQSFGGAVGLAFGYSHGEADVDDRQSDVDADSWHLGLYGSLNSGPFGLAAAFSYASVDSDVTRHLLGGLGSTSAEVDSHVFVASLEASYAFMLDENLLLSPLAGIDAAWVSQDEFEETGGGGAALTGDKNSYDSYTTALGARLGGQWQLGKDSLARWEVDAKWRHRFGDDVPAADLAFTGATPGSGTYRVFGPEGSDDWAELGFGFALQSGNVNVGIRYDGALGSDIQSHALSLTVGASF